ncbi:FecR family protein [soil metagenome]
MNHEQARVLLKKYRLGQCTKEELDIINQWYDSFDNENELSEPTDHSKLQSVKMNMFDEINRQINLSEANTKESQYFINSDTKIPFFNTAKWLKIAAVLLIGVGFIFYLSDRNKGNIDNETVIAEEISDGDDLPSTIFLSDGSIIYLKEDSHLEYPNHFSGNTREVTLVGEAFFKVAKDENKPFIIYSNNLTTRVLGTSFNIKAYENDDLLEVSVVTGKVSVSVNNYTDNDTAEMDIKEVVLISNQRAIYTRKNNSLIQAKVKDSIVYESFENRKLVFNETPLDEIINLLNSSYEVNINLANPNLKNCYITAELSEESLEISLLILTKAIGAEYEIKEDEIIIKGKGCGVQK